ncbi:Dolichyldiphosphatase 1 [Chamberlinius hualienensis]
MDNNSIKWVPLSLTHVEYPEGDIFGKILAFISLTPLVIVAGFFTLIIFRRDLHIITYSSGILLNELINFILKHTVRELRPYREREVVFTEYGMPSSHSQFMWFFAIYTAFFLFIRIHNGGPNNSILDNAWKFVVTLGVFSSALVVSYSRVYLQYHTCMQVVWGAIIGMTLATIWFAITQVVLTPLFPVIASWPISEFLMIRDSTLIPNVMWFEYTSHRTEMRARHRKLISMRSQ